MLITRNNQPVTIVRSTPPHLNGDGDWHGSFTLPEPATAPAPTPAVFMQGAQQTMASPHMDWLGATIGVETEVDGKPVKVSAARVCAIAGNVLEWEGKADA